MILTIQSKWLYDTRRLQKRLGFGRFYRTVRASEKHNANTSYVRPSFVLLPFTILNAFVCIDDNR